MHMPIITFVCPVIRNDYLPKMLQSLYKFTDRSKYKLIIVDCTLEGVGQLQGIDMIIKMKNQGFATNSNTGLRVGLSWGTPYLGVINDDLEFLYPTWLEDALEEFKTDPRIIAINPECPKVPMWGYGHTQGEYIEILPYKEQYSEEDIKYLKSGDYNKVDIETRWIEKYGENNKISPAFPFTKRGVIDAFAGWLPIFKREGLIETGLYDERFVWGGGEDYDWMARAYSCAWPIERETCDPRYHRRAVSTMKSWVWHHWGKSKDESATLDSRLFETREAWNRLDILWPVEYNEGNTCDPWGHTRDNPPNKKPLKRDPQIYVHIP